MTGTPSAQRAISETPTQTCRKYLIKAGAPDALFSYTIPDAVGGNAPLTYTFTHNSDWLSLSGQVISGTPDIFGTWTATVTVTDDDGDTDSSTFDVVISVDTAPSLPAIDDNELTIDQQFEYQIGLATGGNGTLTYSMTGNPSWASLALNFTETVLFLSGTPTETGEWTITITVTDADGDTGSQTFTLTVVADFTVPNLPAIPDQTAINGVAYQYTFDQIVGGTPPFSYTLSGAPSWLTVTANQRRLSGTPTAVGVHTVTLTVSDIWQRDGTVADVHADRRS